METDLIFKSIWLLVMEGRNYTQKYFNGMVTAAESKQK